MKVQMPIKNSGSEEVYENQQFKNANANQFESNDNCFGFSQDFIN